MKRQAVCLPTNSRGIWLQKEAAQELDECLLVSKLVKLTDKSHTELIFLAANTITWGQDTQSRYLTVAFSVCYLNTMRKCVLLPHPLYLSPCPLFYSFYWTTCSEMTGKVLSDQHCWSLLLRMMKRRWRNWPSPCCHTAHRRVVEAVLEKHPHPQGSWPGAGSTAQLDREIGDKKNINTFFIRLFPVRKIIWNNLQSSFMQNFCQLIVLWVAISAQAFKCSIWSKRCNISTGYKNNDS